MMSHSLGQLTSHHWPSFGKGENKGSVLLWYSYFDCSILMFLMREGLQCRIRILKHCLMRLWNDISQLTFVFPFAETRSIYPSAAGPVQTSESSPIRDRRSTTEPPNQPRVVMMVGVSVSSSFWYRLTRVILDWRAIKRLLLLLLL